MWVKVFEDRVGWGYTIQEQEQGTPMKVMMNFKIGILCRRVERVAVEYPWTGFFLFLFILCLFRASRTP